MIAPSTPPKSRSPSAPKSPLEKSADFFFSPSKVTDTAAWNEERVPPSPLEKSATTLFSPPPRAPENGKSGYLLGDAAVSDGYDITAPPKLSPKNSIGPDTAKVIENESKKSVNIPAPSLLSPNGAGQVYTYDGGVSFARGLTQEAKANKAANKAETSKLHPEVRKYLRYQM